MESDNEDRTATPGLKRRLLQWAIAVVGVVAIVASTGGGGGEPSCAFIIPNAPCPPGGGSGGGGGGPPLGPPPSVSLTPSHEIVQAGMPVTFQANAANVSDPTYAWCRAPSGTDACAPLPGVFESSYTIPSTARSDDGARFRVSVSGAQGTATSNFSALYVSSMPPVVFEDGEFAEADWVVASVGNPVETAPTFSTTRMAAGGNPGGYLRETYDIPATVGSTVISHAKLSATYDPGSQGAIYLLEITMECESATPLTWVTVTPMFEQGGRRFAIEDPRTFGGGTYCANGWRRSGGMTWQWVAGPACGSGEPCPDFSASAQPLRFGFMVIERAALPGAPMKVTYGYDNWKASVWRR